MPFSAPSTSRDCGFSAVASSSKGVSLGAFSSVTPDAPVSPRISAAPSEAQVVFPPPAEHLGSSKPTLTVFDSSLAPLRKQLEMLTNWMNESKGGSKPSDPVVVPSTSSAVSENEEEVEEEDSHHLSCYSRLLRFLLVSYPDYFEKAAPRSPTSTFLMRRKTSDPLLPKLVLSKAVRHSLKETEKWMSMKRDLGKALFAYPPSKLLRKRYRFYVTGEAPSLGVSASSQGDFSSLIDSSRRSAFAAAKVFFTAPELDHVVKNQFKLLEVFSFLDWTIGALAAKIEDCPSLSQELAEDWIGVLSCADKSIRDGCDELASLIAFGTLKKRQLWCSFASKRVTSQQKSALLFAPFVKDNLFPDDVVLSISSALDKKSTSDLLAQSTKRPKAPVETVPSVSPLAQAPFRGRKPKRFFRPKSNLRPQSKASAKVNKPSK
ncbi:MAG: hypothetical protein ACRDAX_01060 [Propionibacteriaceae bacterium]